MISKALAAFEENAGSRPPAALASAGAEPMKDASRQGKVDSRGPAGYGPLLSVSPAQDAAHPRRPKA